MGKILRSLISRRMLTCFLMGFSCGLPLLLTIGVLQAWMKDEGVDLSVIGLMSLVGIPYTLKFLWSPILDRFTLPFLGRRRGWLLVIQFLLAAAIVGLGFTDPRVNPWMVASVAFIVTFFSASQDIIVDAYRREDLPDEELGLGSSFYVNGYRVGMLLASGGGLILADIIPFRAVYMIMGLCMALGVITTLFSPEPEAPYGAPKSLKEAVVEPFLEFFQRSGAVWILLFVLAYKLGDQMATMMTTPFYLDIGFTKTQIGAVVKLFGFWATVAGGFAGGIIMVKAGINKSLWMFGIFQIIAILGFAALANIGPHIWALTIVITLENLAIGMGATAYVAFMASQTNKKFTATQYALISSLIGIPRVIVSAPTGYLAKYFGWTGFFVFCSLISIPGILFLLKFAPWRNKPAEKAPIEAEVIAEEASS